MRKFQLIILILASVFGNAGFTMPACSKEQKQDAKKLAAEYIANLAFNKLANLFDEQLNKLETELAKLNIPGEVKTACKGFLNDFRELSGEVRKVHSREDFNELAVLVKALYQDVRFHIGNLGDDIRAQVSNLFDGIGSVVEPIEVRLPPQPVGGDRQPANKDNPNLNP